MRDLAEMRRVAKAATHGKWEATSSRQTMGAWTIPGVAPVLRCHTDNARHIITFSPDNALELLDELEAANAAIVRVLEMHQPKRIVQHNVPCFDEFDSPTVIHEGCSCGSHYYPCPTKQALER